MSDEPRKRDVKGIGRLRGLPYPVAIIAIAWGIVAGLACDWAINVLPLPYALSVGATLAILMGIAIALCLRRWPPSGQNGALDRR